MKCTDKLLEYAEQVEEMRREQQRYFSTKSSKNLIQAKTLEYEVDRETTRIIEKLKQMKNKSQH